MTCRIVILILVCFTPVHADTPQNAIDWLKATTSSMQLLKGQKTDTQNESINKPKIRQTDLKELNFNGIGVIPSEISGINSKIWSEIDQNMLARKIYVLPNLRFYAAQSFFKRLLIAETDPPKIMDFNERQDRYLLARIDRLIKMGALDEAEELVQQISPLTKDGFSRWKKISLLGGRLTRLCKELIANPALSKDVSLRVICFAKLGDWDTAALILSTASSLGLVDNQRETLLVYHLDPQFIGTAEIKKLQLDFDELEFYILEQANIGGKPQGLRMPYLYRKLQKNILADKIYAAEQLTIAQAINGSKLFELYRSAFTDLSRKPIHLSLLFELNDALAKPNKIAIRSKLIKTMSKMYEMNLINPFAEEYAPILAELEISTYDKIFNEICMKLFLLDGEIPDSWRSFSTEDPYLTYAFNLLTAKEFTFNHIYSFFHLVKPGLYSTQSINENVEIQMLGAERDKEGSGEFLLKALHLTSGGQKTNPHNLFKALLIFKSVNETRLAKSIMIDYLVNISHHET